MSTFCGSCSSCGGATFLKQDGETWSTIWRSCVLVRSPASSISLNIPARLTNHQQQRSRSHSHARPMICSHTDCFFLVCALSLSRRLSKLTQLWPARFSQCLNNHSHSHSYSHSLTPVASRCKRQARRRLARKLLTRQPRRPTQRRRGLSMRYVMALCVLFACVFVHLIDTLAALSRTTHAGM